MCTAITDHHLFGRNLDLEYGYHEEAVILPRNYPIPFRQTNIMDAHFRIIGIATVDNGYPLFYDAMNEKGLCMAGLDFPDNAFYQSANDHLTNIAPFELIPWILCQCSSVQEAKQLLSQTNLCDIRYSAQFPQSPLHWILADGAESIVIEPMKNGLKIYDDPVGVLCNNPPFPFHLHHLAGYQHLSAGEQENTFEGISLKPYGGGMGAIGLPGDFSSGSRFIKASFVKWHSKCPDQKDGAITQFFHLLDTVAMPSGAIRVRGGQNEITRYCSCYDRMAGKLYFVTYHNRRIRAVSMDETAQDKNKLIRYPMDDLQDFRYLN